MDTPLEQLSSVFLRDFQFKDYSERIKIVAKALCPSCIVENELKLIYKNILIRNAIQHRHSTVDDYLLRKLGQNHLTILGTDGIEIVFKEGDTISLSLAEIFAFKKAMFSVGQKWRI